MILYYDMILIQTSYIYGKSIPLMYIAMQTILIIADEFFIETQQPIIVILVSTLLTLLKHLEYDFNSVSPTTVFSYRFYTLLWLLSSVAWACGLLRATPINWLSPKNDITFLMSMWHKNLIHIIIQFEPVGKQL